MSSVFKSQKTIIFDFLNKIFIKNTQYGAQCIEFHKPEMSIKTNNKLNK